MARTPEHARLEEARTGAAPWKAWGPYLAERQWGNGPRGLQRRRRRLLLAGAATSAVAAIALGIAATGSAANVFAVFGVWAGFSGAAQLVVGLRRRAQLGKQWPMLLAGGGSVIFGIAFLIGSTMANPMLSMIAIYAATGGIDFLIEAGLLARRRRGVAGSTTPVISAT
jgi:uncharacterized membrane protein HdeD (DUF308 family)